MALSSKTSRTKLQYLEVLLKRAISTLYVSSRCDIDFLGTRKTVVSRRALVGFNPKYSRPFVSSVTVYHKFNFVIPRWTLSKKGSQY